MNIYDEQLHKIEEAEENVRIAKARLLEAEKELDETLELVESELNEEKKPLKELDLLKGKEVAIAQGSNGKNWSLADANGKAGMNISGVATYRDIKTAKESKAWEAMIEKFGKENEGKYFKIVTIKDKDIVGDISDKNKKQ